MDIIEAINSFRERDPNEREASFDYCYNYFYSFYRQNKVCELASPENMQLSCLHLGFFLASWGMMRGSAPIFQKSVRILSPVIKAISIMDTKLWKIDIDNYNDENIKLLIKCKEDISDALIIDGKLPSDTLVTKIMLCVFANVPAFDTNVTTALRFHSVSSTFNEKSLKGIKEFYYKHQGEFDSFKIILTLDFDSGKENKDKITYTKAKLLDMYLFVKGGGSQ